MSEIQIFFLLFWMPRFKWQLGILTVVCPPKLYILHMWSTPFIEKVPCSAHNNPSIHGLGVGPYLYQQILLVLSSEDVVQVDKYHESTKELQVSMSFQRTRRGKPNQNINILFVEDGSLVPRPRGTWE